MRAELEPRSGTWRFVQAYAEKRIAELRERNDRMDAPDVTANTRGQIKAWKELLALPSQADPAQPAGDQID